MEVTAATVSSATGQLCSTDGCPNAAAYKPGLSRLGAPTAFEPGLTVRSCIVGAYVHAHESGELAVEMMKEIFGIHGIPQIVHADRGTSMTSKTVAAHLSDLEVTRSHSRPRVSTDTGIDVDHDVAVVVFVLDRAGEFGDVPAVYLSGFGRDQLRAGWRACRRRSLTCRFSSRTR